MFKYLVYHHTNRSLFYENPSELVYSNRNLDLEFVDMDAPPNKIKPPDPLKWILIIGMGAILLSIIWVVAFPKEGDFKVSRTTDDKEGASNEEYKNSNDYWYNNPDRDFDCKKKLGQEMGSFIMRGGFRSINDLGNEKQIVWRYKAENEYGDYTEKTAVCTIYKEGRVVRITDVNGFNLVN